jgi:hypothetical protein
MNQHPFSACVSEPTFHLAMALTYEVHPSHITGTPRVSRMHDIDTIVAAKVTYMIFIPLWVQASKSRSQSSSVPYSGLIDLKSLSSDGGMSKYAYALS